MIPSALSANLTFYIARTFVILNIAYGIFTGDIPTVGSYMTMMLAVESFKNALNEMFYYVKMQIVSECMQNEFVLFYEENRI